MQDSNLLALPKGTELNHYIIDGVLGQGGFGIVYKAHHGHLDEAVVIKEFLPVELAGRSGNTVAPHSTNKSDVYDDCLNRFLLEGKTLVKLKHHNVVRCRDLFKANATAYLVMDFEDGCALDELVVGLEKQEIRYSEEQLLHFLIPLAEGLAYIHEMGVLHRDIKPANVFIRRSDSSPVILDFGAAKQNYAQASQSRAPFTEFYAPIEQVEGESSGKAKATVDIHAFGGLMYRIVTGSIGPKAERRISAIARGNADPLIPAAELAHKYYSEPLLRLIDECLACLAEKRPQSMEGVVARLHALAITSTTKQHANDSVGLEQLDEMISMAGLDKIITEDEMEALLKKATSLNINPHDAQQYIIKKALIHGWQLTLSTDQASENDTVEPTPKKEGMNEPASKPFEEKSDLQQGPEESKEHLDKQNASVEQHAVNKPPFLKVGLVVATLAIAGLGLNAYFQYVAKAKKIIEEQEVNNQQLTPSQSVIEAPPLIVKSVEQLAEEQYAQGHERKAFISYKQSHEQEHSVTASAFYAYMLYQGIGTDYADEALANRIAAEVLEPLNELAYRGDCEVCQVYLGLLYRSGIGVERNYEQAKNLFELALPTYDMAYLKLGDLYFYGQGVKKDQVFAFKQYKKSAVMGNIFAMGRLGRCYLYGDGVEQDFTRSDYWLKRAIDAGDLGSYITLGIKYERGMGVDKNLEKAFSFQLKAAEAGIDIGMYNVGLGYKLARGVKKDMTLAVDYYKRAANKGDSDAMEELGDIYSTSDDSLHDTKLAFEYFKKAAEKGNVAAMIKLARAYATGEGIKQSGSNAILWYEKAAEKGDEGANAMYALGKIYAEGKIAVKDVEKSKDWYIKSEYHGREDGYNNIGIHYYTGDYGPKNGELALKWYKKSVNKHSGSNVMFNIALIYWYGHNGVKQDRTEASAWFLQSAEAGDEDSETYLRETAGVRELNNLAWSEATCKRACDGKLAVKAALKLVSINDSPEYVDTLAAAYARNGQYKLAVETQKKAIKSLALSDDDARYYQRLNLYKNNQPYTER